MPAPKPFESGFDGLGLEIRLEHFGILSIYSLAK
jgi:hypothetical protein